MSRNSSNPLDVRMARLEGSYEQIDKRLDAVQVTIARFEDRVELRFNHLNRQIDLLESKNEGRFEQVNTHLDNLDTKIDTRFNILTFITLLIGLILSTLQVLSALDII